MCSSDLRLLAVMRELCALRCQIGNGVLHHVLGYELGEAAVKAQMDGTEYRAQLRKAYLRLASLRSEGQISGGTFLEEPALA